MTLWLQPVLELTRLAVARVGVVLAVTSGCGCVEQGTWKQDRAIAFSPDDRAIAYRHQSSVFVARTEGEEHHRIYTAEPLVAISSPLWAPGRHALAFAVANDKLDESHQLPYTIWIWRAPEAMWERTGKNPEGDTAVLPSNWIPPEPIKVVEPHVLDEVQIRAKPLVGSTNRMRSLQAQGFLALIDQASGDGDRFTTRMVEQFLPGVLALTDRDQEQIATIVTTNLDVLTSTDQLQRISKQESQQAALALEHLSELARTLNPDAARALAIAASVFHRESGDVDAEIRALSEGGES